MLGINNVSNEFNKIAVLRHICFNNMRVSFEWLKKYLNEEFLMNRNIRLSRIPKVVMTSPKILVHYLLQLPIYLKRAKDTSSAMTF